MFPKGLKSLLPSAWDDQDSAFRLLCLSLLPVSPLARRTLTGQVAEGEGDDQQIRQTKSSKASPSIATRVSVFVRGLGYDKRPGRSFAARELKRDATGRGRRR